jgi:hypothetical protein
MSSSFVKKSIGKLRPAARNKPRSPAMTGKLALQRSALESYWEELQRTNASEIHVPIAVWPNRDREGIYLSLEVSPLLNSQPAITMEEFFQHLNAEDPED